MINYSPHNIRLFFQTFLNCDRSRTRRQHEISENCGFVAKHLPHAGLADNVSALVLLIPVLILTGTQARANSPDNVHALVYSVTSAELFFVPRPGQLTRISRDGQHIGTFDTRSLFIDDLDPSQLYRFDLQSESPAGEIAPQSRVIEISTGDFSGPSRFIGSRLETSIALSVSGDSGVTETTPPAAVSEPVPQQPVVAVVSLPEPALAGATDRGPQPEGVCMTSGTSLQQAVANFAAQCPLHVRVDCDPDDGGWLCSSQTIASASAREPVASTQTPASDQTQTAAPTPAPTPAPTNAEQNLQAASPVVPQPPAPAPSITATPTPVNNSANGGCEVRSLGQLRNCINGNSALITVQQSFSCSGDACCAGASTLSLIGKSNIRIEGNGHRLTRNSGHRQCHLIDMRQSRNITFNNWVLDDNAGVRGCQLTDRCPHMLDIRTSNNIRMNGVSILNSKGYATWLQGVDGFTFERGEVSNSGVLGMYIGHSGQPSRNIRVSNSRFLFNQTNGLAVLGLTGSRAANRISNNVFIGNHWRGQFAVAPQFGTGFTGGGQVYIAEANGLTLENNTIRHGYCVNCLVTAGAGSGVTALELGLPQQASVRDVLISRNTLENHDAWGVGANSGTRIGADIAVTNNIIRNVRRSIVGSGYSLSGNQTADTARVVSFEGNDAELNPGSWSGPGTVRQQCGGASLGGRCVIELTASAGSNRLFSSAHFGFNGRRQVTVSGWLRGASAQLCLALTRTDGSEFRQCGARDNAGASSPINGFNGFQTVSVSVPQGTTQARLQVIVPGGQQAILDDVKLAFN